MIGTARLLDRNICTLKFLQQSGIRRQPRQASGGPNGRPSCNTTAVWCRGFAGDHHNQNPIMQRGAILSNILRKSSCPVAMHLISTHREKQSRFRSNQGFTLAQEKFPLCTEVNHKSGSLKKNYSIERYFIANKKLEVAIAHRFTRVAFLKRKRNS